MRSLRIFAGLALSVFTLQAHVGSPDVYLDAKAGPYELFITIQPAPVVPGAAQLQVRAETAGVREIRATPLGMTGASAKYAPIPDVLERSKDDPQYFTGSLWLMASGSMQIRFTVSGDQGPGTVSLPLPAIAQQTKGMQTGLGALLFALMTFLVFGLVAIAGAAVREARLQPGVAVDEAGKRRSRFVMAVVFAFLIGVIWLGNRWWNSEAGDYAQDIYKPLEMQASLVAPHVLKLELKDPGWFIWRKVDDLVPDHNHLMHLYLIREPGMDVICHLHPELKASGLFELSLPSLPAGQYRLYADIVHADGFPETMVASISLPEISSAALQGDDAQGRARPVSEVHGTTTDFALPDGYRMIWLNGNKPHKAKQAELFRFKLIEPGGRAPADMAFYMGMLGHAAFVKTDGSAFAHIHPNGSVAMAAFMMTAEQRASDPVAMPGMSMANMHHDHSMHMGLPDEVSFPYGFPTPGRYRIVVQMKHGETIETGVFDAEVE